MTAFSLSAFLRERFLRDHAHLISPWDCKPSEAVTLSEILRRRNWLYWEKKREAEFIAEAARKGHVVWSEPNDPTTWAVGSPSEKKRTSNEGREINVAAEPKYTNVVIPMGTLPDGPMKDHYERLNREAMEPVDNPPA